MKYSSMILFVFTYNIYAWIGTEIFWKVTSNCNIGEGKDALKCFILLCPIFFKGWGVSLNTYYFQIKTKQAACKSFQVPKMYWLGQTIGQTTPFGKTTPMRFFYFTDKKQARMKEGGRLLMDLEHLAVSASFLFPDHSGKSCRKL